jgi:hypothetical protein
MKPIHLKGQISANREEISSASGSKMKIASRFLQENAPKQREVALATEPEILI